MTPTATLHRLATASTDGTPAGSTADRLVLIVSPGNGRFRPAVSEGPVAAGGIVAQVAGGRDRVEDVACPVAATIQGLLTRPGQLVIRGQALAWAVVAENGSAA
jgi:hypothetical protein